MFTTLNDFVCAHTIFIGQWPRLVCVAKLVSDSLAPQPRLQAAAQPRMVLPSAPAAQELRPGVRPSEWVGFKGHLIVETMFFYHGISAFPADFVIMRFWEVGNWAMSM